MGVVYAGIAGTITSMQIANVSVVWPVAATASISHIDWEARFAPNPKELTYLERYAMERRHRKSWSCPSTLHGRLAALKPKCARFDWRQKFRRQM